MYGGINAFDPGDDVQKGEFIGIDQWREFSSSSRVGKTARNILGLRRSNCLDQKLKFDEYGKVTWILEHETTCTKDSLLD